MAARSHLMRSAEAAAAGKGCPTTALAASAHHGSTGTDCAAIGRTCCSSSSPLAAAAGRVAEEACPDWFTVVGRTDLHLRIAAGAACLG